MVFNSAGFAVLFAVTFMVFYYMKETRRWIVLLAASLVFYAALKAPHLLIALALVTVFSYFCGLGMARSQSEARRRLIFWAGVLADVLVLVYIRYLPFFATNANALLKDVGIQLAFPVPELLVTVGVSFYVFQAISYLTDIYLEVQEPEPHFGYFALYLSFFPKLLQGPIERASDLLPQLHRKYEFSYEAARSGLFLFALGLFKKVVLADRLGQLVDPIYNDIHSFTGLPLILATYGYAFQLYFDFSAYTDMAIGVARLFGLQLTDNFNSPYLAVSVPDFWRRWHITFSRWILDYLFKPLQFYLRNLRTAANVLALLVTFLLCGLWHGASWHFVLWGLLHGVYMASSVLSARSLRRLYRTLRLEKTKALKVWQVVMTFNLVSFAWIFFRANSVSEAFYVVTHLFQGIPGQVARAFSQTAPLPLLRGIVDACFPDAGLTIIATLVVGIVAYEATRAFARHGLRGKLLFDQPAWVRWAVYYGLVILLLLLGNFAPSPYIYFQF